MQIVSRVFTWILRLEILDNHARRPFISKISNHSSENCLTVYILTETSGTFFEMSKQLTLELKYS